LLVFCTNMTAGDTAMKPVNKPPPRQPDAPPDIPKAFRALGSLTVEDLKQDPGLAKSLKQLRQQMLDPAASSAQTGIVSATSIAGIKQTLTPAMVTKDVALKEQLRALKVRCGTLKTKKLAHTFNAVGESPDAAVPPCPAGLETVASIGPGWIGPHRLMESYRRPTGPGKR